MKKLILISSGISFFLLLIVTGLASADAQEQDTIKRGLSPEQLQRVKQRINTSQDFVRLDPERKGSFDWWGWLDWIYEWDFYHLVCGEGELEIHLTSIPEFSDYDLYLFDCNAVVIDSSINSMNDDEEIIQWVSTDSYWIGVYCYYGGSSTDSYHLYGTYETPPTLADLMVKRFLVSDLTPTIGDSITITITVKNIGDTISDCCFTDLYLDLESPPEATDEGDFYWYTLWLDPDSTTEFTQEVTSDSPGVWQMYAFTDSYDWETEKNECNNIAGPLEVEWLARPDLVVQDFCIGNDAPETGDWVNIIVVIRNDGGDTARNFYTDLYYNRASPPVPPDLGDDSFHTDELAPGDTKAWAFYIGNSQVEGWNMYVLADARDSVEEGDENNNVWGPEQVNWFLNPDGGTITREEIIQHARDYILVLWRCPGQNSFPPDSDYCVEPNDDQEWTSDFVTGEWYTGEAYEWGGWDRFNVFDHNLLNEGQRAGVHISNDYLPNTLSNPCWSTGIDCSGLVSRCWELSYKHSTRTLFEVAYRLTSYDSLKMGDALDDTTWPSRHVRIFLERPHPDTILVFESISYGIGDTANGCNIRSYPETLLVTQNYLPIRYNNVYDPPNNNPVIEGHIECKYPLDDCGECMKPANEVTLEITASDPDGDPIYYEWYCFPFHGYFLENGLDTITTEENYVTYVAPSSWWLDDHLWIYVWDDKGGFDWTDGVVDVYETEYSCVCGDANKLNGVEAGDIVYLLVYLNKGGAPPPDPYLRGDANNNCEVEAGDVVYLISYLYRQGPPPECCWFSPNSREQ